MKFILAFLVPLCLLANEETSHYFAGKHFLGSYIGCDRKSMADLQGMIAAMDDAVRSSGATILNQSHHIFDPNGLTLVYLLSESHASIHTYPEFGACFVDLFTCGDHCTAEAFDQALRAYLRPQIVNARMFIRNDGIQEIALHE
ncbi:MAG: adenosylmethionine decarboxylase [Verrucomicrobiota bacterium]|nr:adenosylmethionine decarboxylase [Verrucomicrobiota bacterium]